MNKLKRVPWIFIAVIMFLAGCSINAVKSHNDEAPAAGEEVHETIDE